MHVHVSSPDGTAKFWLEPIVALENHFNLTSKDLSRLFDMVKEHEDEFKSAWREHFSQ